jgi:hypothetical protein
MSLMNTVPVLSKLKSIYFKKVRVGNQSIRLWLTDPYLTFGFICEYKILFFLKKKNKQNNIFIIYNY